MDNKTIPQRKRLAAIFASFAILVMGTLSLLQSRSLDYYSVLGTLIKIIPACIILGGLGWVMGMILDRPRKVNRLDYTMFFAPPKNSPEEPAPETETEESKEN